MVAPAPVAEPSVEPTPEPTSGVLGRSDLLALAAQAADAAAQGRAPGAELGRIEGRRFELRLPFGCNGPAAENSNAPTFWRYDPETQALRVHVTPIVWAPEDWWVNDPPPDIDTIEGFWIMRPWTSSEECPSGGHTAAPVGAEAVTLPGQTLAIGEITSAVGAREGRRDGKPYQAVIKVPEDELHISKGFRLRIKGRVTGMPSGGPVRCQQPAGPDQWPICLIGAMTDEVAIENPATGETLATWSVAQRGITDR